MRERCASPYHLLLDTGASSTTNVKMKKLHHIIAGLLVIGLLAQSGLAKTKSRNGRTQRQAYLPPQAPSQGPAITEEYITIHEEAPSGHSSFQESNYGDGRYQIFEIHSHYEPGAASGAAPGYLPPGRQEIRVEHVHQAPSGNGNRLSLGSNGARGISQHAVPISAPAPVLPAVPVPFPSSYKHDFSSSQSESVSSGGSGSFAAPVREEVIHVEHIHLNNGQQTDFQAPDYLPPHGGNVAVSNPQPLIQPLPAPEYRAPDYLPPHQEQQQHIQQQHSQSHHFGGSQFNGPDYLPPHQEHHAQQPNVIAHHQQGPSFKAPDYLPPHTEHHDHQQEVQFPAQPTGQFRGPDYLPPHHEHHHETVHQHIEQHQHTSQHISQGNQFKGPDYLPPHQEQQTAYKGPDYLPPHPHHQQPQTQQNAYKGPDYLPPHQAPHGSHQNVQHQIQQQQTAYKGPDYLPPHQEQHSHQHNVQQQIQQQQAYKGPDYLPPHNEQHHEIQHQPGAYKGPDYLPPHNEQHHEIQHQPGAYKGPDYLPPHQEPQSHHHGAQQQIQQQQTAYKGPDYLPPHHEQQQPGAYKGPDYLPPHQGQYNNHQSQSQHTHASSPGSLPAGYEPQIPAVPVSQPIQQPLPHIAPQHHQHASGDLPPGYDFDKPANAEQAIAELHTLPEEHQNQQEVVVQSQIQVAQGPQQADIIYGSQQSGVNYQTNGYLPPHQSTNNYHIQQGNVQTLSSSVATQQNVQQYQQSGLQQVAPQTFTPTPAAPAVQAPVSTYLAPATPVQAQHYSSNLRSLSSYMTNVQPFQRYASAPRQPFREYGPPTTALNRGPIAQQQQQQHYQQPQLLPVAPMYREPASRPPYYAPAMSYATNAVAHSHAVHHHHTATQQQQHATFNQQTQQNLQHFMPSDVRRPSPAAVAAPAPVAVPAPAPQPAAVHTPAAVPVRQSTSSKIRTVQIVNPAAVKTLKVLETSDQAGVKTIKILGQSNAQPRGEHHVIKVVTQNAPNAHEHVQTVKIFNDHEEVPSNGGASGNAYLPPSARRARQTPLKLQLLSNEQHRRPFTGRRRYRF